MFIKGQLCLAWRWCPFRTGCKAAFRADLRHQTSPVLPQGSARIESGTNRDSGSYGRCRPTTRKGDGVPQRCSMPHMCGPHFCGAHDCGQGGVGKVPRFWHPSPWAGEWVCRNSRKEGTATCTGSTGSDCPNRLSGPPPLRRWFHAGAGFRQAGAGKASCLPAGSRPPGSSR